MAPINLAGLIHFSSLLIMNSHQNVVKKEHCEWRIPDPACHKKYRVNLKFKDFHGFVGRKFVRNVKNCFGTLGLF